MTGMKNTSRQHPLPTIVWLIITALTLTLGNLRADDSPSRTIVVVGDSISAAYGIATEDGWVALLQKKIEDESFNMTVVNASVSGDTTANGLSRLPNLLTEYQPALVVIELGGNDGLRGLSVKKLKSNLNQMAAMARDSGAEVIIVSVQLPGNYGKAYNNLFAKAFASAAEDTNSTLVPSLFEGLDASKKWFQADGIHPGVLAQPVMLENVWQVATPLLEKITSQ